MGLDARMKELWPTSSSLSLPLAARPTASPYCARSAFLSNLPTLVLANASTNRIFCGTAKSRDHALFAVREDMNLDVLLAHGRRGLRITHDERKRPFSPTGIFDADHRAFRHAGYALIRLRGAGRVSRATGRTWPLSSSSREGTTRECRFRCADRGFVPRSPGAGPILPFEANGACGEPLGGSSSATDGSPTTTGMCSGGDVFSPNHLTPSSMRSTSTRQRPFVAGAVILSVALPQLPAAIGSSKARGRRTIRAFLHSARASRCR